ncbi:hypothetical protein JTB14_018664 [Gonioctena quinquepunctata]|nr:hypothetical protein JTB14_018664 [Gonioctena quinquepunctata]
MINNENISKCDLVVTSPVEKPEIIQTTDGDMIMEKMFAKRAWCNPVAVASSTGLSSKHSESNESVGNLIADVPHVS